jgi:alkylated DNA repair dioxygenase AlkB
MRWQHFELPGADVRLAQFCDAAAAQIWFARLHAEIPWEQHRLRIFGREVDSPRLSCWIGDADAVYTYSGSRFEPKPWTPALAELREALIPLCGEDLLHPEKLGILPQFSGKRSWQSHATLVESAQQTADSPAHPCAAGGFSNLPFNSVLCNLYRSGHDAMGWHSDNEPELGPAPVIASLSFGATRRFRLRNRRGSREGFDIDLDPGSLLLMAGATQANYRHNLPRTARDVGPRINLTFRTILPTMSRI